MEKWRIGIDIVLCRGCGRGEGRVNFRGFGGVRRVRDG